MMARWTVALAMLALLGTAWAESSGKTIKEDLVEKLDLFSLCPTEERMDLLVDELPSTRHARDLRENGSAAQSSAAFVVLESTTRTQTRSCMQ